MFFFFGLLAQKEITDDVFVAIVTGKVSLFPPQQPTKNSNTSAIPSPML